MSESNVNLLLEMATLLVEEHGYLEVPAEGRFVKQMDAQHWVGVTLSPPFRDRSPSTPSRAQARCMVSRLDINKLRRELFDADPEDWFPSVTEAPGPWFFGEPPVFLEHEALGEPPPPWLVQVPSEPLRPWLDKQVLRLEREGPSLSFVRRQLELSGPKLLRGPWICNRLLDGWDDEAEEALSNWARELAEEDNDAARAAEEKIGRVRAWIAEHPDGVERELAD